MPLEEYRNNRGFLHRERLEEEADFSSVGTCYVTDGEKREWSLGKYKYRLAALGEDIVDNIAWQGHGVVKENGDWQEMKEVLYLYQQEYDMPAGEVSEILLPFQWHTPSGPFPANAPYMFTTASCRSCLVIVSGS